LPVVIAQDTHGLLHSLQIGDSWIHGVASDAGKLAEYRAMQRMRRKLSYDHSQDPAYRNLSRLLLKVHVIQSVKPLCEADRRSEDSHGRLRTTTCKGFDAEVLQVPEHTWGVDIKEAMPDYRNWSNADFGAALAAGVYDDAIHAWRRQRSWLDWALEALGEAPGCHVYWRSRNHDSMLPACTEDSQTKAVSGPRYHGLTSE